MRLRDVIRRLSEPVDVASLVAFRVALGALVAIAVVRHWRKGGITDAFVAPKFFFPYPGLDWLRPLGGGFMHGVYAAMFVAAVAFAVGLCFRASAVVLFATFTYAHLADAANYLNHYYLVSLLVLLSALLPLHVRASVDAWRRPSLTRDVAPRIALSLVRFQLGVVYFFGGVAKLEADWLLRGMPLRVWLAAAGDFPVLGPFLRVPEAAWVMSWAGAAFDLATPFLLLARRTRPYAYAAVCVFHLTTARLFQIGMFPWIMMASALVFFEPSWPRRLFLKRAPAPRAASRPVETWMLGVAAAYVTVQVLAPLRSWLYPGDVLWTEEGFRFSWRVMLVEKTGSVEFTLRDPRAGHTRQARPRDELTPFQIKMMATQPDMIASYAKHLADERERHGEARPQVFVDAVVVLNGRAPARFVDPTVDLGDARARYRVRDWLAPMPAPP